MILYVSGTALFYRFHNFNIFELAKAYLFSDRVLGAEYKFDIIFFL